MPWDAAAEWISSSLSGWRAAVANGSLPTSSWMTCVSSEGQTADRHVILIDAPVPAKSSVTQRLIASQRPRAGIIASSRASR